MGQTICQRIYQGINKGEQMTFYPFYEELEGFAGSNAFIKGNFGLWYNKLIPIIGQNDKESWCACDNKGSKNGRYGMEKGNNQSIERLEACNALYRYY